MARPAGSVAMSTAFGPMRMNAAMPGCAASVAGALGLAAGLAAAGATQAQTVAPVSPSTFHGYELGTTYTLTHAHIEYYRALAAASPRVRYEDYGRSTQGRPLPVVLVGSEANLTRLDELRQRYRRLTDAVAPLPAAELEALTADLPALVFIFIVDTDEEAGVEALQEVAYELATGEDAGIRSIRENVVVGLFPLTNPDSHARYVTWHKIYDVDGASVDPLAIENDAHWAMNTDGNAWGVDVNRDFGWFVTPEMRAFARKVMEWRPQFFLDVHSGPDVIFMPPFPPPHHPLWPEEAPKWWNALAQQANRNFGPAGMSFFSRKNYEGVAGIGFGLSWGMLGPAVSSFLFEAFGGRPGKTTSFVRSDGTIATMRMAMDHHKLGIRSLLEVARDRRAELLRDAHARVVAAAEQARANAVRGVVIPAAGEGVDPDKVARLIDRLTLQEVEVRRAERPFTARSRDFFGAVMEPREFPAGSYVIDFVQPRARLARAVLDPTVDFSKPMVEVPYDRRMPYYDAPWGNLPYLFGVPAFAVSGALPEAGAIVREMPRANAARYTSGAASLNRSADAAGASAIAGNAEPYGWVLPAGRESSYRVVIRLLRDGYNVRVFTEGFRLHGEWFPKGTFAAIRQRNPQDLGTRIDTLARELGARLVEAPGPFTEAGLTFGDDDRVAPLPQPRVAILADWPVNHDHTYGGIRSTLEGDFGFPFSPLMLATVNGEDLSKYTAVVLPHAGMDVRGGPNFTAGYRGRLELGSLRRYVTGGGTLIAVQGAAEAVAQDSVLGRGVRAEGWARFTEATLRAEWVRFDAPDEGTIAPWRPGLDRAGTHMLAAGYERPELAAPGSFPVLLGLEDAGGAEVVARYSGDARSLLLDGYMTDGDRATLAGRPFAIVQPVGRGRVIYVAEDLTYRGAWYGMNVLFLNALLFGPIL